CYAAPAAPSAEPIYWIRSGRRLTSVATAQWITSSCGCARSWDLLARRSRLSGAWATVCDARAEAWHDTHHGPGKQHQPAMPDSHLDSGAPTARASPDSTSLARALAGLLVRRQPPAGVG